MPASVGMIELGSFCQNDMSRSGSFCQNHSLPLKIQRKNSGNVLLLEGFGFVLPNTARRHAWVRSAKPRDHAVSVGLVAAGFVLPK
jgi:hypothetical protein